MEAIDKIYVFFVELDSKEFRRF